MLIVPFTYFAANGLWKVTKCLEAISISKHLGWLNITKKIGYTLMLVFLILGGLFVSWPLTDTGPGLVNWSGSFKYFPSTMQTSSIPLQDTKAVIKAYTWLNNNMNQISSLFVHGTFEFWTLLYLKKNHVAYLFDSNIEAAINRAQNEGYQLIYIVCWNQDIDWYPIELLNNWISVYDSGRISVYPMD